MELGAIALILGSASAFLSVVVSLSSLLRKLFHSDTERQEVEVVITDSAGNVTRQKMSGVDASTIGHTLSALSEKTGEAESSARNDG